MKDINGSSSNKPQKAESRKQKAVQQSMSRESSLNIITNWLIIDWLIVRTDIRKSSLLSASAAVFPWTLNPKA